MNKWFYIGLLLVFYTTFSLAQAINEVKIDSSELAQKLFTKDFKDRYQGGEFNYETGVEGEAKNFIARALSWFFQKIAEFFGIDIDPATYQLIEFFVYGILIALALYMVVRLLTGNNVVGFFRKKESALGTLNVKVENIENVDLDALIREALAQENYRLVIRYMYLKALKELAARNLIQWHYDKTNSDYQREIQSPALKEGFREVSYVYDYVWYGEFSIDSGAFQSIETNFERFTNALKNAR